MSGPRTAIGWLALSCDRFDDDQFTTPTTFEFVWLVVLIKYLLTVSNSSAIDTGRAGIRRDRQCAAGPREMM